ncbi:hypothetical protein PR048_000180 [Dryococelus australis]|uniref:DUF4817 domain-containing protein n=1 Tax=Dryococelus australis TaxID=614101 RepID=A0ABQ9IDX3_9NEOP|nr:hypothetical protein PR048_000180 [Dryococelus australis]
MFSIQERVPIMVWRLDRLFYCTVQTRCLCRFHKAGPTDETIQKFVNKFKRTRMVATAPGQHPSTSDSIEAIRIPIEQSLKSVRGIVIHIEEEVIPSSGSASFIRQGLGRACSDVHTELFTANEECNILAHVSISGNVNRHNCSIWADKLSVEHLVYFQQDGAPCPYALDVRTFLNAELPGRRIGCEGTLQWAAHSPDLTPMDILIWEFIKRMCV